jgi:hypothetical protein
MAEVYEDRILVRKVRNTGSFTRTPRFTPGVTYRYQVCQAGTTACSNTVAIALK